MALKKIKKENKKNDNQKKDHPLFIKYKYFVRLLNMEEQKCRICGIVQPISEFHKNGSYLSGYLTKCKNCVKKRNKDKTKLDDYIGNPGDVEMVEKILTNLGYELYNDENPVYFQFKRRIYEEKGIILK